MNNKNGSTSYSVPPVERALSLLRHIGDGNKCRNLSSTSKELGINRTTLIRLIHTLEANRMIEAIDEGAGYRLGVGLITLAAQAVHGRDLVQVCQPLLMELAQETGLSSHLGILDGRDMVYLSREMPNTHLVSNMRAGSRLPAHASSSGRAILAAMSDDDIRALFSGVELEAPTDKTPLTLDAVLAQAREDRAAGFAWSEGNFEAGIGSCAVAVLDHRGKPVGAINVSGPESVFTAEGSTGDGPIKRAVRRAANAASTGLGHVTREG
ncbi:IclR family transcriptional regulator [Oceanibium sediminis]|uniref:IclR family transcriptional regulator n=1 Tax=Oceanibium sediminis TaxID=2026339 RepID=UPI0018E51C34|nr:IclR family transcriptional regulator [Oceanibium sediminis]